jgi:hypothetical protein
MRPIVSDPFLSLHFFAKEFGVSAKHLENVSLAQRGLMKKQKFSKRLLGRYPKFIKGPGGKVGLWSSQYRAWREQIGAPVQEVA